MTKELILQAREKANAGLRLNLQEALALYEDNDLLFLADCARRMKEKKSGRQVFYNVNKHINLTNICTSGCPLCAFQKKEWEPGGFVLEEILQQAGLSSLPGGGAEILSDRVREIICPKKATTAQWIETIKTAHKLGIRTNCTMMYGHIETIEERLQHLFTLRDIQDETGGFQAFVSFPFHPANTGLDYLKRVGSWEDMKMMALSRLILDNVDHIKAFWIMLTMPIAQLALGFGADDLDGTIGEEKIIHAAGANTGRGITRSKLRQLITEAGFEPVERDTFYHPVETGEEAVK